MIMLTLGANEGMNHVKVFSQLARKLVNKNFRQSLFAAQDAQSILDVAKRNNILNVALKTCAILSRRQTKLTPGKRDKNSRYPETRNAAPLHESTDDIFAKSSSLLPFVPNAHIR